MKKKIQYSLIIGVVFMLSSCLGEEKNLFPESAALRLNNSIANAKQVLVNQSQGNNNGWIMEYFPTNDTEGYTFLMSFNNSKSATIAARNQYTPVYTTETSVYDIVGDTGPVLTFDSYNKVFHLFSNPVDPNGGNVGNGLKGDYEFIVLNISPDNVITLKGKKRGTTILMRPLAQGQDWKGYFDVLDKMDTTLFGALYPQLLLQISDNKYILSNGYTHIFNAKLDGGDPLDVGSNLPFIITDYGIRLGSPFIQNEDSTQQFALNEGKTALVDVKDASITITPEPISSFINKSSSKYYASQDDLKGAFLSTFNKMAIEFNTQYGGRRDLTAIGFRKDNDKFNFLLRAASNEAIFTIPYTFSSGKITINTFDGNNMASTDMDNNASLFYTAIPSIKEMLTLIQGTYDLSSDYPFSYNTIKYTKNNNDYLVVKR